MVRDKACVDPFLRKLSTEELENLLAQDYTVMDGENLDTEYIMAIMEVMRERDEAAEQTVDVDAAWENFKKNYQGQAGSLKRTIPGETESSHLPPSQRSLKKARRVLRYAGIAAALVVLLCGTALGFGWWQALVTWTAETFGFVSPYDGGAPERAEDDPYRQLWNRVSELTALPVIPNWAPEGTTQDPDIGIQTTERKNSTKLTGSYESEDCQFIIRIQIYEGTSKMAGGEYQRDDRQYIIEYETGGFVHYIMSNNKKNMAAWTNENVECVIQGDLSIEDLERMIDSIYKE